MKQSEFLAVCRNRQWDKLDSIFDNHLLGRAFRIIVCAVYETYHFDPQVRKTQGLAGIEKNLANYPTFWAFFAPNLLDFTQAYWIAKNAKIGKILTLGDDRVAQTIHDFVRRNKLKLAKILDSNPYENCSKEKWDEKKRNIKLAFGDLTITEKDYIAELEKQKQAAAVGEKNKKIIQKRCTRISSKLTEILGFACEARADTDDPNLACVRLCFPDRKSQDKNVDLALIKLKQLELTAFGTCSSRGLSSGIIIYNPLPEVVAKLYPSTRYNPVSNAYAFFLEKERDGTKEMMASAFGQASHTARKLR